MANRHQQVNSYQWAYQPVTIRAIDADLAALEANTQARQVTQAQYDALTPTPGVLYVITEPTGITLKITPQQTINHVRYTATGATFAPTIELAPDSEATVHWTVDDGTTATGAQPAIDFGTAATRAVYMSVVKPDGSDALADVHTINLGFDNEDDAGRYQMGVQHNWPTVPVSEIIGITHCTNLRRFAAARTTITSPIDFTGCSALEYIEVAYSRTPGVTLTGCTSLIRLCLEQTRLTQPLDLNPVAANLYDLRAARQFSLALTLTPLTQPLQRLYHLCVRDQTVTNHPTYAQLPVVEELWNWNTGQAGTMRVSSTRLRSWLGYGNQLTGIDLTGTTAMNGTINLADNALTSTAVDYALTTVQGWGNRGGTLDLSGVSNASPSAAGRVAYGRLAFRGWNVTTNTVAGAGVTSDTFDRADAVGLPAVGNGWYSPNAGNADIVGNSLVRRDSSGYQVVANPAGASLPANYTVTATVASLTGTYYGVVGRWDGVNGVRALFTTSRRTVTIGNAVTFSGGNVTLGTVTYPPTWDNDTIDHTIALRMVGDQVTLVLDGVDAVTATVPVNPTVVGTGYGICGEGQSRAWRSIVTSV